MTAEAKATEIFELQAKVDVLEQEVASLKLFAMKADKVINALRDMVATYGNYRGSDNRLVPAVITGAWPTAGTVDIVVFDNQFSGGKNEITGVFLGTALGEMQPYLASEPAEEESDGCLLAS